MFLSKLSAKRVWANILLILTTFFWGVTFVVVKDAVSQVNVFVFLGQRFSAAFIILLAVSPFLKRKLVLEDIRKAIVLGVMLFGAFALQTWALKFITASNTAFLTGLNVVLVPLFSSFIFKLKVPALVKAGVILSVAGLYLLCARQSFILNTGDLLAFLCALFVSIHIIYTGRYSTSADIFWLSTLQIGVVGGLSCMSAFITGHSLFLYNPGILKALVICVLFATIFAYLVQTTMQQYISPTNTALIFCLEPVFAAICAYVVSGERLGVRGILGGLLMFAGMILPELPIGKSMDKTDDKKVLTGHIH